MVFQHYTCEEIEQIIAQIHTTDMWKSNRSNLASVTLENLLMTITFQLFLSICVKLAFLGLIYFILAYMA